MKIYTDRPSHRVFIVCFFLLSSFFLLATEQEMTVSAVGDCIISHKISHFKDPQFLKLVELLRSADCTYGNCETTLYKPEEGFPAYKDFDPNVFCYPWGADEMKWLGIDLMSLANNHIMDFDYNGLFATIKHLDRVGIAYAGAGKDLNHATRAGYFQTAKGSVALISCSSWLPEENHQASMPHAYMNGKPGLNPVNLEFVMQLDKESFAKIKSVRDAVFKSMGFPIPQAPKGKEITMVKMIENTYQKSDEVKLVLKPNKKDIDRIKKEIAVAKRNARLVIVSLHEHVSNFKEMRASTYQEEFAHACIDAGADMFFVTGPHELLGIEIYKGKAIFHSIGNFMFQALRIIAPEAYERLDLPGDTKDPSIYEEKFTKLYDMGDTSVALWESAVPLITFDKNNKIKEIVLHPITLDEKADWHRKGVPRPADKKSAKAIIKRLIKMSKYYKTKIVWQESTGTGKIVL